MKPEILPPHEGHVHPRGGEYIVVTTRYPTTYGRNSDQTETPSRFYRHCDVDAYGPGGGTPGIDPDKEAFVQYADALSLARNIRDDKAGIQEWFTDHPYASEDDAPFDSAIMNNKDSDEEVLIQVMTKTDFAIKMQRIMLAAYPERLSGEGGSDAMTREQMMEKMRREKNDWMDELIEELKDDDGAVVKIQSDRWTCDKEEMQRIVDVLDRNNKLRKLQMQWSRSITVEGMEVLANWVGNQEHLERLTIRKSSLFCNEVIPLAHALARNTSLVVLDLTSNNFDCKGASALAEALKSNATLLELILNDNYVYDDAARKFADALRTNKTLERLSLLRNGVATEGINALASAMEDNASLKRLDLHYYEFSNGGKLKKLVDRNNR